MLKFETYKEMRGKHPKFKTGGNPDAFTLWYGFEYAPDIEEECRVHNLQDGCLIKVTHRCKQGVTVALEYLAGYNLYDGDLYTPEKIVELIEAKRKLEEEEKRKADKEKELTEKAKQETNKKSKK